MNVVDETKQLNSAYCHVCSEFPRTRIFKDEHNNYLAACDSPVCSFGYTYVMPYAVWVMVRKALANTDEMVKAAMYGPRKIAYGRRSR